MRAWVALVLVFVLGTSAEAQFSGSSFGGSRGFGGGSSSSSSSSYSSSSSSSWGSSSSSSYNDDSARRERERQAAEDSRRRAEEARRAAEAAERARIARLERERLERERIARELARDQALPIEERAQLDRFSVTAPTFPVEPGLDDPHLVRLPPKHEVERTLERPPGITEHPTRMLVTRLDWINGGLCAGPSFLFFALIALLFRRVAARRQVAQLVASAGGGHVPVWTRRQKSKGAGGSCELRRISIAFDWTQRKKLQKVLENVGTRHNVQSEHGMFAAAQEVARILAAALPGARYAMWESRYAWPNDAEKRFFAMASDLKARYRYDAARGQVAPDGAPKAEEGKGFVVVSLVLGATRRFPALPDRLDPGSVAQALTASLSITSRELVAVDVVWSPALERDRMSSAEMVEVYPELLPLASAADLGRIQCSHCSGIFAGELERCPVCGAPR